MNKSRFVPNKLKRLVPFVGKPGTPAHLVEENDEFAEDVPLQSQAEAGSPLTQEESIRQLEQKMKDLYEQLLVPKWGANIEKDPNERLKELAKKFEGLKPTENGFQIKLNTGGRALFETIEQTVQVKGENGQIQSQKQSFEIIRSPKRGFNQNDANAVMLLAGLHGWKKIEVHGTEKQKEKLWLAAQGQGLEVVGYEPQNPEILQQGEAARAKWGADHLENQPIDDETPYVIKKAGPNMPLTDKPKAPETGEAAESEAEADATAGNSGTPNKTTEQPVTSSSGLDVPESRSGRTKQPAARGDLQGPFKASAEPTPQASFGQPNRTRPGSAAPKPKGP